MYQVTHFTVDTSISAFQMLAECLLECHNNSCETGKPLELRVFACGGAQLGNDGTAALAEVFKVIQDKTYSLPSTVQNVRHGMYCVPFRILRYTTLFNC